MTYAISCAVVCISTSLEVDHTVFAQKQAAYTEIANRMRLANDDITIIFAEQAQIDKMPNGLPKQEAQKALDERRRVVNATMNALAAENERIRKISIVRLRHWVKKPN